MNRFYLVCVLGLFWTSSVWAGTPVCQNGSAAQQAVARQVMGRFVMYDGSDKTVAAGRHTALGRRLAARICHFAVRGEDETKILNRLERRKMSLGPAAVKVNVQTDEDERAGEPDSPVKVVVFACSRCPFCARLVPGIYKSVTGGVLRGKARLYFKPFPLKNHPHSKEGGMAIVAARQMGGLWPMVLALYRHFSDFSVERLGDWAAAAGLDRARFDQLMKRGETRRWLVDEKKQGLALGVRATPQLVINGKMYRGFLELDEVIDVVLEEAKGD